MTLQLTPLVRPADTASAVTAKFYRGLGHPTRVEVLRLLSERERSVSALVELTGKLQGRLSSHLACLRWCGFVETRREGRSVYYRIADPRVTKLLKLADEFLAEHGEAVEMCGVIEPSEPKEC